MSAPRQLLKSIPLDTKETVLEYLKAHGSTKSNTPYLYRAIGKSSYRGLEDVFRYLEEVESILIKEKIGKAYYWRLKDKDLINEKLSQKDAISLSYAIELNKEEFSPDTIKTLKKMFQSNSKTLLGNLSISEELDNEKMNGFYNTLTYAIEEHLYLKLEFLYALPHFTFYKVKPIKIIFVSNNWYLAFEYQEQRKRRYQFGRLAFIKKIEFCKDHRYSTKNRFKLDFEQYINFLENDVQNAMTLYDVARQKAIIRATPNVARYFKSDMKKVLPSQKFIQECENGSVLFSLDYTQSIEILPLIQKWLPDLIIVQPKELREEYIAKLEQTLQNLTKESLF
ncbi:MAG: hypothetical protein KU38_02325 [Sulfurovum sp. FS08-3]|nr:MAG: hypothetical protein KU38_02325 [Sulfurovum sp. FS08-3]